jgi:hypothetical protein
MVAPALPPAIFFHPDRPPAHFALDKLRRFAGWRLADGPEDADWCVLNQDQTWVRLPPDDPYAALAPTWINGRCRDISKRRVEALFATVFGYPLAIDPTIHHGPCIRKSDWNAAKGVTVLTGPIAAAELDDQAVYERLVDSRLPGLGPVELRVDVVAGQIVSVVRRIYSDWISTGLLTWDNHHPIDAALVVAESVFSPREQARITEFCTEMGLDFGALDVLRDNADGRIYLLDVNKTPTMIGDLPAETALWPVRLARMARAFVAHYPPRSAVPGTVTPDLAHLAAEVGQVRADLDALLSLLNQAAMASLAPGPAAVPAGAPALERRGGKKRKRPA